MELYIAIGVLAVVLLWGISIYNRLVSLSRLRQEGWSGVLVQLKRRHDLVPNLVNTVKGYMTHEQGVLEEVTRARALQGGSTAEVAASENQFTQAIGRLFALAENYPDLKASSNFLELQQTLAEIEEELQLARRYFNGTVRDFNILVASFPSLIVARLFAFVEQDFFELDDQSEAAVPNVQFTA